MNARRNPTKTKKGRGQKEARDLARTNEYTKKKRKKETKQKQVENLNKRQYTKQPLTLSATKQQNNVISTIIS